VGVIFRNSRIDRNSGSVAEGFAATGEGVTEATRGAVLSTAQPPSNATNPTKNIEGSKFYLFIFSFALIIN